ncbi:MAG: hypothetical protein K940chlam5_00855 [Candidatus Anoxychlamydiales bacterium]|nr:hypothetical protein [Candidatus Anoxychlamydiales bacterium]
MSSISKALSFENSASLSANFSVESFPDVMFDKKGSFQAILLNGINAGKYFLPEYKAEFKLFDISRLPFPVDEIYYHMRDFVLDETKFDEFYIQLVQLLDSISSNDGFDDDFYLDKINELVQILVKNGFDAIPPHKQISYWSGKDVKEFIFNDESQKDFLVDLKIPAYIVLFELSGQILLGDEIKFSNDFARTFRRFVCKHLASQAKKNVNVYVSSDDLVNEDYIRVGNHFWQFELPVLQALKQNGVIKTINFIFFDKLKKEFKKPIEFSSDEAKDLRLLRFVPVEREIEISSPMMVYSIKSKKIDFVPDESSIETKLTLGKLKAVIERWKEIALAKD